MIITEMLMIGIRDETASFKQASQGHSLKGTKCLRALVKLVVNSENMEVL